MLALLNRIAMKDRASGIAAGILVGLFLTIAVPTIFLCGEKGRAAADQNAWHLPTIQNFARELPHPYLHDYKSATTPGYHLLLAVFSRATGITGERSLRLAGMLFTVALLALLGVAAGRKMPALAAIAVCLPVLASPYVFASGVWLLPDNAAWLFVLLAILLALRGRVDTTFFLGSALVVLLLVWMRQTHLWVIAPILTTAWVGRDVAGSKAGRQRPVVWKITNVALACLWMLPAVECLIFFFRLWHGPVPPSQQGLVTGGNAAAPAALLAEVGFVGIFYAGFISWTSLLQKAWKLAAGGALAGGILALLPATTYDARAGRFSGLWNLVPHAPVLFGHASVIIVFLSTLGGAVVVLWLLEASVRDRWIWLAAFAAFVIAQSTNHYAFYRYYEPAVLMAAVVTLSRSGSRPSQWAYAGPATLAAISSIITIGTFH